MTWADTERIDRVRRAHAQDSNIAKQTWAINWDFTRKPWFCKLFQMGQCTFNKDHEHAVKLHRHIYSVSAKVVPCNTQIKNAILLRKRKQNRNGSCPATLGMLDSCNSQRMSNVQQYDMHVNKTVDVNQCSVTRAGFKQQGDKNESCNSSVSDSVVFSRVVFNSNIDRERYEGLLARGNRNRYSVVGQVEKVQTRYYTKKHVTDRDLKGSQCDILGLAHTCFTRQQSSEDNGHLAQKACKVHNKSDTIHFAGSNTFSYVNSKGWSPVNIVHHSVGGHINVHSNYNGVQVSQVVNPGNTIDDRCCSHKGVDDCDTSSETTRKNNNHTNRGVVLTNCSDMGDLAVSQADANCSNVKVLFDIKRACVNASTMSLFD